MASTVQQPVEEVLGKISNQPWQSHTDSEARITKMNDGRTHLACEAEHAVDLESQAIVAAHVPHADRGDGTTGVERAVLAQTNLTAAGSGQAKDGG